MFNLLSPVHLVVLLVILLLVFGPRRLPEIGSGIGQALKEFKKGIDAATAELEDRPKLSESPEQREKP
jgi:sec-independent protein translocase protein TatA